MHAHVPVTFRSAVGLIETSGSAVTAMTMPRSPRGPPAAAGPVAAASYFGPDGSAARHRLWSMIAAGAGSVGGTGSPLDWDHGTGPGT